MLEKLFEFQPGASSFVQKTLLNSLLTVDTTFWLCFMKLFLEVQFY